MKEETRKIIILSVILLVGFLYRNFVWFYGFHCLPNCASILDGENPHLVTLEDGYLKIASSFDPSNNIGFFDHYRSISFIYPLYLSPIFIFGLDQAVYIFWLHHLFAALTIIFIYLSTSKIGGTNAGLLAAWVYVCQLQIAFWFNWSQALTTLHFQLAVFVYCSLICWERASPKHVFLAVITGAMVIFTRPEAGAYAGVSLLVLMYRLAAPRFGGKQAISICLGLMLVFLLSGVYILTQNKGVRDSVYSNVQVGSALYWGSQETLTEAKAFDHTLNEMRRVCRAQAAADPKKRNMWWWCSTMGVERIKEDPLNYLIILADRFVNRLYPSFYRDGVSWRYKVQDRIIGFFITFGVICVIMFRFKEKLAVVGLTLMALACLISQNFVNISWDVREQLSIQVLLIPVASIGWIMFLNLAYKKLRPA